MDDSAARPAFPNYLQIPSRVPNGVWIGLRITSVAVLLSLTVWLAISPTASPTLFWKLIVPVLPAVFAIVPGFWRNICPLAAINQTPRVLGFTRGLTQTSLLKEYSFAIGIGLFLALASSRLWLFNHSAAATAGLLLFALAGALVGGFIFKGKSGWCSSLCPLLPVQRLYGQAPVHLVRNAHCATCVGCAKNCYDFNPTVAYLADQYDDDPRYVGFRRFFAGVLPGFILAFYTAPSGLGIGALYAHLGMAMAISLGIFRGLEVFLKLSPNRLPVVYGGLALALYYCFAGPVWFAEIEILTSWPASRIGPFVPWVVTFLAGLWMVRAWRRENIFRAQLSARTNQTGTRLGDGARAALAKASAAARAELYIEQGGKRVPSTGQQTILELVEGCGSPIESGCRMGVCGADPVAVLEGMDNLNPAGEDERSTIARLGFASNTRMACCARLRQGSVRISLAPEKGTPGINVSHSGDPSVKRVVILGNGIAGVTAADHLRRHHPDCAIQIVAAEKHPLYNRMAITKLIYGRSAMAGLHLLPENWYAERKIEVLLNTRAVRIQPQERLVELGDGGSLPYDRLILATGSSSFIPPMPGFGGPGCGVLRTADEGMAIRAHVQQTGAREAVVAGGGLLGLEAAYALHKLGLHVTIAERNHWLLHRQLDEGAGRLLKSYLESLGLGIVCGRAPHHLTVNTEGRRLAHLSDGSELAADIFLVAAGIAPNIELAREAGLATQRGVLVDESMRTSDPAIFAAGDVAEYQGRVPGLWAVSVEQATVAALALLGRPRPYVEPVPATILKVVGAEVFSAGRFEAREGDEAIVEENSASYLYRKIVISDGKIAGTILLGYPHLVEAMGRAVKTNVEARPFVDRLRAGDWRLFEAS